MANDKEINERLAAFAKLVFGSVRQMGPAVGRSQGYFSVYFSKGVSPPAFVIARLQKLHGLNVNWLETGEGEPVLSNPAAVVREPEGHMRDLLLSDLWDSTTEIHADIPRWEELTDYQRRRILTRLARSVIEVIESFGADTASDTATIRR